MSLTIAILFSVGLAVACALRLILKRPLTSKLLVFALLLLAVAMALDVMKQYGMVERMLGGGQAKSVAPDVLTAVLVLIGMADLGLFVWIETSRRDKEAP